MRMKWRLRRLPGLIAAPALVAGALVLTGAATASASTCFGWQSSQPSPNSDSSALNSTDAVSACDVWAVGWTDSATGPLPLIVHWTGGASWTTVPSPDPTGNTNASLTGVRMISPTDGWAVGYYRTGDGPTQKTLILHWDGTSWTQVPSPNPGAAGNQLLAVTAMSSNDVWAVGAYSTTPGASQTLTLHWDGSSWQQVTSPDPGASNGLSSVSAVSSSDVWAVGFSGDNSGANSDLALHWNGTSWSQVPTDSVSGGILPGNRFASVSADAPNDVWAVGAYISNSAGPIQHNVIEHWDGSAWTVVPIASTLGTANIALAGVKAFSFSNVWAVGTLATGSDPSHLVAQSLVLHWNGVAWFEVTTTQGVSNPLNAVDGSSAANVWTVGTASAAAFATPVQLAPQNVQVAVSQLGHTLYEIGSVNGAPGDNLGLGVSQHTSPAIAMNNSGQSEIAWTGKNGDLWILDPSGQSTDTGRQLVTGTSPGIAALPSGGFEIAFANAADGLLWERAPDGTFRMAANGLGVAPGTSPAIAADESGGFEVAFHANGENTLWTVTPDNIGHDTRVTMGSGSSPGIAALEVGGYEVVFTNAADGLLYEMAPDGTIGMAANGLGVEPGTSPAVAADTSGAFEVAFHANGENTLWTVTPDNTGHDTRWPLMDETSPGIATLPEGGFEVAFESPTSEAMLLPPSGALVDLAPEGSVADAGVIMSADSSPSIAAPATFANATLVPNVMDDNQTTADNVLSAAGLVVGTPVMDTRCIAGPGIVLAEGPAAGTRVALGSTVILTVSTGRDPRNRLCQFK